MAQNSYFICLGLIKQGSTRIMPLGGKSSSKSDILEENLESFLSPIALELLVRVIQRTKEGAIKAAAIDKSILIVKIPMNAMQEYMPIFKRDWIETGKTDELLKNLRRVSDRIWSVDFVRYEGLKFRELEV